MSELDWIFIVILILSTLIGVSRGMVRELFALVGWCAAFFVSLYYSADLAAVLPLQSAGSLIRTIIAIVLIVIGCVFVAGLAGRLIRYILSSASIGAEDTILGCLFGFLRGLLVVGLLVYLGGHSTWVAGQDWWKASMLIPYFEQGILFCQPYIPEKFFG